MEKYKTFSDLFEKDLYQETSLETCVTKHTSLGAPGAMDVQIEYLKQL